MAQRVGTSPVAATYWHLVDDLALGVHGLVHAAVGLLAERDARRRTAHLGIDQRGRSIRILVDLTERPTLPEVTDDALAAGTWSATLILLVEPYSTELADLLGNALTSAVSDRVPTALREVDRAALALERRLDRDEKARAHRAAKSKPATETERARAELESLGVTL